MDKKKHLGQFYTTNYQYILQGMTIPDFPVNIIEPFAGNCDLLNFIPNKSKYTIECFDIEPQNDNTIKQDTLDNPPNYNGKFVITNPPYLAKNKAVKKTIFNKYDVDDLYKCFIKQLINAESIGGIIIIPLNFLSSIRKADIKLRKDFLQKYCIQRINIFEEDVFNDTSYTVCAIQYKLCISTEKIPIYIYPSNKFIKVCLTEDNNYTIGGKIYNLPRTNKYDITRLTKKNINEKNTNILVKCIDNNSKNKIGLSVVEDDEIYIDNTPNLSARSFATLIIKPELSIEKQKELVVEFNNFINKKRDKYNSLFLTNYRESKDIARKRISFDLVYNIIGYLLECSNHQS
jgi:hypothetical protein